MTRVFALVCLLAVAAAGTAPAWGQPRAAVRADRQFTTYAYAHEFGSGIYDLHGRTLQVYRLPFSYTWREATAGSPGLRLTLPLAVGFLDFRPMDFIETGLPDRVDSLSFVPGLELEYLLRDGWQLTPYLKGGVTAADVSDVTATVFGTGVRARRSFGLRGLDASYGVDAIYSQVDFRGSGLADDEFVRIRNALELRRATGFTVGPNAAQFGAFALLDAYVDAPTGPATQLDVPRLQFEAGLMLGAHPRRYLWRVPLPRIGLSYRVAGDLSGWRIVLGEPF